MSALVILNVVLDMAIVSAIVGHLARSIVAESGEAVRDARRTPLLRRPRVLPAH